ncbi:MAG: DUF6483 family protein [Eubacteriales bacterium]|nr:DUF6483 family protein [Eubacteriales bacterium]
MDFERDYILRLIHMMGDLMRRVGELMDDLQRMHLLDDACRRLCGMTVETARSLSVQSLCELLGPMPRFLLSELLYLRATQTELSGEDRDELLEKALRLLASLHEESRLCELRAERLTRLKAATAERWDAQALMDCARFFAQSERYDEMEDALFQALEREEPPQDDRGEAIRLLRRAAKASPQALALCRMTAQELRESAHELEPTHEREQ